jgi:hypothetical protein
MFTSNSSTLRDKPTHAYIKSKEREEMLEGKKKKDRRSERKEEGNNSSK